MLTSNLLYYTQMKVKLKYYSRMAGLDVFKRQMWAMKKIFPIISNNITLELCQ